MAPKGILGSLLDELHCMVAFKNQSGHDLGSIEDILAGLPEVVLEFEGRESCWHISLVLTTDDHLRQLHAEHHGADTFTDVMAFLYGSSDVFQHVTFGEIVVSVDRAIEQAEEAGWSLMEELSFLLIHGMLHLCDWQDDTDKNRKRMFARQHEIMQTMKSPNGV